MKCHSLSNYTTPQWWAHWRIMSFSISFTYLWCFVVYYTSAFWMHKWRIQWREMFCTEYLYIEQGFQLRHSLSAGNLVHSACFLLPFPEFFKHNSLRIIYFFYQIGQLVLPLLKGPIVYVSTEAYLCARYYKCLLMLPLPNRTPCVSFTKQAYLCSRYQVCLLLSLLPNTFFFFLNFQGTGK